MSEFEFGLGGSDLIQAAPERARLLGSALAALRRLGKVHNMDFLTFITKTLNAYADRSTGYLIWLASICFFPFMTVLLILRFFP